MILSNHNHCTSSSKAIMTPSEATSSPPPLSKRSRCYSDEEDEDELEEHNHADSRRTSRFTLPSDVDGSSCRTLFVPHWSVEDGGWGRSKVAEDDIALLEAIEEHAATYSAPAPAPYVFPGLTSPHSSKFSSLPQPSPSSLALADLNMTMQSNNNALPSNLHGKAFKCPICPKSFTRNYDLTRHRSSHQDERQHVCQCCGRSFNRRDALSRHNMLRGCARNGRIGARQPRKAEN
ncbi:uncharacterized protein MELLADRAFT_118091 [Melampsora larici-populina 98AG31]|uniref:C2H2-type domain-containing protein n=1 Tax=Melampsora larici-populina (strain 98AG31 / pathotype 3-4-7) TaxID=747676 RepID=F4S508_MELLP|nr:uncharacterized protein MELLADRAFT_118091 [Melampsora larici-populina 98AG31]EGG00286.1 hypothetical protein MELLADRAFT_118091 [Melampsora larici-populina 98AG31]